MVTISESKIIRKVIEFPDNRLMIDLCGQLDSNLARIEDSISVKISRRGNWLEISGQKQECASAVAILRSIYARLDSGNTLETGDIEAAIRMPNEFFGSKPILIGENSTNAENLNSHLVQIITKKKTIVPRTMKQKEYIKSLEAGDITFGVGPAGTGKTYLAVAVGVSLYLNGMVDKIVLTRPAVEAGERLGVLPGDMKEKVDPYMQPLYDALGDCLLKRQITKMIDQKHIEIAPLAFMRGRTLSNAFVVLDEAQNATTMQMKMFLTRLGENSRMVVTGDTTQIDLPKGIKSGLLEALKILKKVNGINFSFFNSSDVVRHKMVSRIIKAYEKFNEKKSIKLEK